MDLEDIKEKIIDTLKFVLGFFLTPFVIASWLGLLISFTIYFVVCYLEIITNFIK